MIASMPDTLPLKSVMSMLVEASRAGDLHVVLRLIYTNPFVDKQELHDSLWEAVRYRRLDVLRSLIEFRVDPDQAPSSTLSTPPKALDRASWTPLVALALEGCGGNAELVAELVGRNHVGTKEVSDPKGTCNVPAKPGKCPKASITFAPQSHVAQCPHPALPRAGKQAPDATCSVAHRAEGDKANVAKQVLSTAAERSPTLEGKSVLPKLPSWLGDRDPTARESFISGLKTADLVALEAQLECTLGSLRAHRQQRWEQQLQSVQRRHDEESRGRQTLEEEQACVVCSAEAKIILFLPCRHLCTCQDCSKQLSMCPICRSNIEDKVQCIRP